MRDKTVFAAGSLELSGGFAVSGPLEAVFELFSPPGEKLWVPNWNPEMIHPRGITWERGLIFRTQEERGEAVWVVSVLDRDRHEVEYYRVEAGRYVAKVRVQCQAPVPERTEVSVGYTYVGLSDAGNREIAEMSRPAFERKMRRWQGWISSYLSGR